MFSTSNKTTMKPSSAWKEANEAKETGTLKGTKEFPVYNKDQVIVIDRLIAERIILCCLDQGYEVRVHDGEGWDGPATKDFVLLVSKLFQADVTSLYIYPPNSRQHVGWVLLIGGESGWDVIVDHSMSIEPLLKEAEKLAEEFENGTRSPVIDRHYYIEQTFTAGAGQKITADYKVKTGQKVRPEYVVKLGQHDEVFEGKTQLEVAWHAHKLNTGEIVA